MDVWCAERLAGAPHTPFYRKATMSRHRTRDTRDLWGRCRVRRLTRCVSVLAAGVIAIVGMTACGNGGTVASGAAVEVAGQTVSKATLEHWIPVEAIISREPIPKQPVPEGEVPDPPHYTACIAYLKATTPQPTTGQAKPTTAQLKSQCQQHYEAVRRHMLEILISYAWTSAEATAQGITVSDHEVEQKFTQFKHEQYPTEAIFQKFLKYTGENLSDELLLVRFDMLSNRLEQKIIHQGGIAGATEFYREFPKRWAAKTSCNPGYVVPDCKQYKGSLPPEAQI